MTQMEERRFYRDGYIDGLKKALDTIYDYFAVKKPEDDLVEIIVQIIIDVQTKPLS